MPSIILYEYSPTRSGGTAAKFLSGFSGYLACDGYTGYNKVPEIKRCCCWAHVRRYFIDAVPKGHEYDYSNPAVQGVRYCSQLFELEEHFRQKGYSYEKRKELRLKKENPLLETFWCWLDNVKPLKNSRSIWNSEAQSWSTPTVVTNIKKLFPIQVFNQRELCALTNNPSKLIELIDSQFDKATWSDEKKNLYLIGYQNV